MAGIFATSGSNIEIGQVLSAKSADFVFADFSSQSWVTVSWLENIGSFGDESTEVTFDAIAEARMQKLKGTRNAGNLELICGIDYEDEGQDLLRGAELVADDFSFRVTFNDAPVNGTPSERYFIAKVMSVREQLETANNVMRLNATLGINSNIVRVAASS